MIQNIAFLLKNLCFIIRGTIMADRQRTVRHACHERELMIRADRSSPDRISADKLAKISHKRQKIGSMIMASWDLDQLEKQRRSWTTWPFILAKYSTLFTARKEQSLKYDFWQCGLPVAHSAAKIGKKYHLEKKLVMTLTSDKTRNKSGFEMPFGPKLSCGSLCGYIQKFRPSCLPMTNGRHFSEYPRSSSRSGTAQSPLQRHAQTLWKAYQFTGTWKICYMSWEVRREILKTWTLKFAMRWKEIGKETRNNINALPLHFMVSWGVKHWKKFFRPRLSWFRLMQKHDLI